MPKMPDAREDHRDAVAVAGGDDILVALAATGLDDGGYARHYGSTAHSATMPLLLNACRMSGTMLSDSKIFKPTIAL